MPDLEKTILQIEEGVKGLMADSAEAKDVRKQLEGRLSSMEEWRKNFAPRATSLPGCEEGKGQELFSFSRAVLGVSSGWTAREVQDEAGKYTRDVMEQATKRAQEAGQDTKGGYVVPAQMLPGIIELLRPRAAVIALGATELNGLRGSPVSVPKETAAPTVAETAENAAISFSDASFGEVSMTPKMITGGTKFSRRVVAMSNPAIEGVVQRRLASELALKLDLNALRGTGALNQPIGVANWPGINTVAIGANGGPITYDLLIDMEGTVEDDNALMGRLAFLFHGKIRRKVAKLKDADNRPLFTWDPAGPQPSRSLIGYPYAISNQIPTNLAKGSGTNLSEIYFGNWQDLWIGYWGNLILEATTQGAGTFENHQVAIKVAQDVDVAVVRPDSFCLINDVESA